MILELAVHAKVSYEVDAINNGQIIDRLLTFVEKSFGINNQSHNFWWIYLKGYSILAFIWTSMLIQLDL